MKNEIYPLNAVNGFVFHGNHNMTLASNCFDLKMNQNRLPITQIIIIEY